MKSKCPDETLRMCRTNLKLYILPIFENTFLFGATNISAQHFTSPIFRENDEKCAFLTYLYLRGLDTPDFDPIFQRETTVINRKLLPLYLNSFKNWCFSLRKDFEPHGSKFFPIV